MDKGTSLIASCGGLRSDSVGISGQAIHRLTTWILTSPVRTIAEGYHGSIMDESRTSRVATCQMKEKHGHVGSKLPSL